MIKQISPDKDMNFHSTTASFTVSTEPRALLSCANLPADSAFYDVSVPFGKLRAGSGLLFCYRLPSHDTSRDRSCLSLVITVTLIILKYTGSLTGDLNPISSCPCRAYTSPSADKGRLLFGLLLCSLEAHFVTAS